MTVPRGARAWIRTLRVLSWVLLLVGPVLFGHAVVRLVTATPADEPPPWRVVRKDSRIDRLLPKGAALERIAEGFAWVEGPAWHQQDGYLLFSDVANNAVYQWREGEGSRLFLKPSGYTGRTPFRGREPFANSAG